ncbi:MAG: hypothetical protein B7X90_02140 [Novosphingobium sp. 17-62-19]|uniref:hypothetical protein n=1 Tax=Novosphingobium sp. 17-62-19 TaxID=1970406 RepID=UPI000BDAE150|nr:hypothetical protein [Novosphingobium sp. 17-62-19]OZA21432.1 MAG: hypothetical protein B7X90_02140 [Novosphingobium sp. 17-62-19]HQS96083.1 hypothetical protein [Novosphingobium sp.]
MNANAEPLAVVHIAHIRRETIVSTIINAAISAGFFWFVFGEHDPVAVWGVGQWVFDYLPQSFMIALMSTLVPGALTAKKLRAGTLTSSDQLTRLPRSLIIRALLLALTAAVLGSSSVGAIAWMLGVESLANSTAMTLKVAYGAGLAFVITPIGLRAALARQSV